MTARRRASALEARLVLVTCAGSRQAAAIARALVGERIAACVNIVGPMRSIYRWRGVIEDQREYLMIIKTRAALYSRLERRLRALHDYEVPEILALAPHEGSARYLDWLLDETTAPLAPPAAGRRPER